MAALDVMGDKPREGAKMGGGHRKRARGGTTTNEPVREKEAIHEYNAEGSPEMKEATNRTPGFRRGGKLKDGGTPDALADGGTPKPLKAGGNAELTLKDGGEAHGEMDRHRHDRHQRGGSARTPYSSGSQLSPPKDDRAGRGYEGGHSA